MAGCSLLFDASGGAVDASIDDSSDAILTVFDAAPTPPDATVLPNIDCNSGSAIVFFDFEGPEPLQDHAPSSPVTTSVGILGTGPYPNWPCGDVVSFDENSRIIRPHEANLASSAGSVDLWLRPTVLPQAFSEESELRVILRKGEPQFTVGHFAIYQYRDGIGPEDTSIVMKVHSDNRDTYFCSPPVNLDCWNHVLLNFGGGEEMELFVNGKSHRTDESRVFVDGELEACEPNGPTGNGSTVNFADVQVGGSDVGELSFEGGHLDNLRYFSARRVPTIPPDGVCD